MFAALALVFGTLSNAVAAQPLASVTPPQKVDGPTGVIVTDPALEAHVQQQLQARAKAQGGITDPTVSALAAAGDKMVRVSVQLDMPALASLAAAASPAERAAYAEKVSAFQDAAAKEIVALGGEVFYKFTTLSSGLLVRMPGRIAPDVAKLSRVTRLSQVQDYQVDLTETVPFIGATAVKDLGFTGKGVKVAVLDSGIDFTHMAFDGPGTIADWEDAYYGPSASCINGRESTCANRLPADPDWFGPEAPKVKGGYDWVGPGWPTYGFEQPDPNPIALAGSGDHGTHVADIIGGFGYGAGTNADGSYPAKGEGVAPGVDLYAFTVCSSITTSCSGFAMLAGLDDAADLDNDPRTKDPADVLNMSLGSPYGQPEDDATYLVNQYVQYGGIAVISAGNSGDLPFVVGSPSSASGAISVAQTMLPTDKGYLIESAQLTSFPLSIWQPWSVPITVDITAELAYPPTNRDGCAAFTAGSYTGKVLLLDRGTCSISVKVANAGAGGAVLAVIANNVTQAPYDLPPTFSYGGGTVTIPGLTVLRSDGTAMKAALVAGAVTVTVKAAGSSLAYSMAASSSRGPRNHDNMLKPDIGAPGASTSALAGTGTEAAAFGGTSGAAPMVTGVAALMKDLHGDAQNFTSPHLLPQQYKALLMNTANNEIYKNGAGVGYLAAVSRIGGGQVDAEAALNTDFIAWDSTDSDPLKWGGSLSFAYQPVSGTYTATRKLTIYNMGHFEATYYMLSGFRYNGDYDKGAMVTISDDWITIPAGETKTVDVTLDIDLANAGFLGGMTSSNIQWPYAIGRGMNGYNGYLFDQIELGGYVKILKVFAGELKGQINVPFHALPKAVAEVEAAKTAEGKITLANSAKYMDADVQTFALMDQSPKIYGQIGDCMIYGMASVSSGSVFMPGCNQAQIDIKEVGVALDGNVLSFAVTVWDEPYRAGQFPAEFDIYVDTNLDGTDDYLVYNYDLSGGSNGSNVVFVVKLATSAQSAYYYTNSDFDSNNYVLPVPASALGITADTKFGFQVLAYDGYFTGALTDWSPSDWSYHRYQPSAPRFQLADPADLYPVVPTTGSVDVKYKYLPGTASGSQTGFLFLYDAAPIGKESSSVVLADFKANFSHYLPLITR
jgi:minor extracellular serine protease Vpr